MIEQNPLTHLNAHGPLSRLWRTEPLPLPVVGPRLDLARFGAIRFRHSPRRMGREEDMAAHGKRNTTMTLAKYRVEGNDRQLSRCSHTLTVN